MTFYVLIIEESFKIFFLDWAGRVDLGVGVSIYFHLVKSLCDLFPLMVIGAVYTGKLYEHRVKDSQTRDLDSALTFSSRSTLRKIFHLLNFSFLSCKVRVWNQTSKVPLFMKETLILSAEDRITPLWCAQTCPDDRTLCCC